VNADKVKLRSAAEKILLFLVAVVLTAGFVYLYWTRFTASPVMSTPISRMMGRQQQSLAIALNAGIFILFLLFLPYRKMVAWRSKGIFSAFMLALMAEMFGIPFLFYLLSPLFRIPVLSPTFALMNNPKFFGWPGMVVGAWLTLIGMVLVILGWRQIYRVEGLVQTGLYARIRHPQYTGIFLILTGWLLHWPTLLTLLMYPVLLVIYYRLARREERAMLAEFGEAYQEYCQRTAMFLPGLIKRGSKAVQESSVTLPVL
jgi:methanethiol S-methyltransferase